MNNKLIIIFLNFFPKFFQSSNDNGLLSVYYNCLNERYNVIIRSEHMKAIVCYLGEECLLISNSCKRFNTIKKTQVEWIKVMNLNNSIISHKILNDDHFNIDFATNNFRIFDVSINDEGIYKELELNVTIIKFYHITVIKRSLAYPIYADSMDAENELSLNNDRLFLPDSNIEIVHYYSNFSECHCTKDSDKNGYRTKNGECFLRVFEKKNQTDLEILIHHFSNKVSCFSKLISKFFNLKSSLKYFRSIIIYQECHTECNTTILENKTLNLNLDLNNQFSYESYEIINANEKSMVLLACPSASYVQWKFKNFLLDKIWSNYTDDRISVDKFNRLVIGKVLDEDETSFICFRFDSTAIIYLLKVNHKLFDKIYNLLNMFGIYSLLTLLFLVIFWSKTS